MEDICVGYDSTIYNSPGIAVQTQIRELHNELDIYRNKEKTIILLDNAKPLEKEIYNNFMYIYTYGYDLRGWKIRCVYNSEDFPYKFIFSSDDTQLSINTNGVEEYIYKDPNSERYIFIGYRWSNHVNNINWPHSNNLHLEIGDVSTVPYTLLKDIKSNIMDISQIVTINTNNITLIKSDITDFIASDMIEPDLTIENSYISNISNAGSIYVNPISNSAFSCKIYSITKNTVYKIKASNHQLADSFPSAIFTTTYVSQPDIVYKLENYNVIHNSTATK